MCNTFTVKVLECIHQLSIDSPCIILGHPPLGLAFEETVSAAARDVFEDEYNLIFRLNSLIELCNVWMRESFHESNLAPNRFFSLDIFYFFFFVDFKGNFFVQLSVHSNVNDGVGTLTNFIADNVIAHAVLIWENDFICSLLYLLATFFGAFIVIPIFFSICLLLVSIFILTLATGGARSPLLWSPNVLSVLLGRGWICLVSCIISATCTSSRIGSCTFWWYGSLIWISLSNKAIGPMAWCWLGWWPISSIIYFWLEKGALWVLMNCRSAWGPIATSRIWTWCCIRRWYYHIMHQLLLTTVFRLITLSCAMLFTILIEIKWLSKSCRMHVISSLWIHNSLLGTILTNHQVVRCKYNCIASRWTGTSCLNLQIQMMVLWIKSLLVLRVRLRKHTLSRTASCRSNISMLLILLLNSWCILKIWIWICIHCLG